MPQQRIISLVPSITQMLHFLGLDDEVVGITKFCIHPKHWHQTKTRVGGTKNLHLQIIKDLQPTLIIANKEENVKEQIEVLQQHYKVLLTDVNTLEDAYKMILNVGIQTNTFNAATYLANKIQQEFTSFTQPQKQSVAYLIWYSPLMVAASNSFINNVLEQTGFTNVFSHKLRYPEITIEDLNTASPNLIFLSSEPYPFKEKHIQELQLYLPNTTKILLVDGEMFSWYGSKLLETPQYIASLLQQTQSQ